MKKVAKVMLPLLFAAASFGQSTAWLRIVGVVTAPGTSNTVAGINSGGPWTASGGTVTVNLTDGTVAFVVAVPPTCINPLFLFASPLALGLPRGAVRL